MIFNSISRELNQNSRVTYTQFPQNSQSYFPKKEILRSNPFRVDAKEQLSMSRGKQSALSRMNSQISENLEYLKYKDNLRTNQLRSSRVSSSSNRSARQIQQAHNPSNLRSSSRSRQSEQRTSNKPNRYYQPDHLSKTNDSNFWRIQKQREEFQKKYGRSQFKNFSRDPVTISQISQQQTPTYHLPTRDPPFDHLNRSLERSSRVSSKISQQDEKVRQKTVFTENQAPAREWTSSFAGSLTSSSKIPQAKLEATPKLKDLSTPIPPTPKEKVSPLEREYNRSNKQLMISAGLIALGVIILVLQLMR